MCYSYLTFWDLLLYIFQLDLIIFFNIVKGEWALIVHGLHDSVEVDLQLLELHVSADTREDHALQVDHQLLGVDVKHRSRLVTETILSRVLNLDSHSCFCLC